MFDSDMTQQEVDALRADRDRLREHSMLLARVEYKVREAAGRRMDIDEWLPLVCEALNARRASSEASTFRQRLLELVSPTVAFTVIDEEDDMPWSGVRVREADEIVDSLLCSPEFTGIHAALTYCEQGHGWLAGVFPETVMEWIS